MDLLSILKRYWGYDAFRPQQEAIIRSVLDGRDTLALLPTGGGKSVCYQVPALAQKGICLVVSPLIALMKDQVDQLKNRGIGALLIYSGMSRRDIVRTLENARGEYFKFLYVSPERLETSLFLEYLPALDINLVAIDEAHCISQWGYDFRPAYLRIAALRKEIPDVPLLALTASATPHVQEDICNKLHFRSQNIFRQSFERSNLSFSVFKVDSKINKLVRIVKKVGGTGIVYCKSRKRTKEIADLLQMHGISADHYHAGLTPEVRAERQQAWMDNKINVIACTNAFGMGIDKGDVRFVVHADMPDCIENYYQEAGRCGRDGRKAYAVLLFDETDLNELSILHEERYPSFEKIKEVYNALVNFLQVPLHSGQDCSYSFELEKMVYNFNLNVQLSLNALKALEQDGWLEYNEKSFIPSTLVFTTSKESLYEFYRNHPAYEEVSTLLLRTYDGIFGFPAFISETTLAGLLKMDLADIKEQLLHLHAFGIVNYTPQNALPQLIFRKNRVATEDLKINMKPYQERKELFRQRVGKMIAYTVAEICRSNYITNYFGEPVNDCGICDNCLKRKTGGLTPEEFNRISTAIELRLSQDELTSEQLLDALSSFQRAKTWKVIEFLKSENRLMLDSKGCLSTVKRI